MNSILKFGNIPNSLLSLIKQDGRSCLFFFLVGLALRGIPELLITYYPVGYETITYYAPIMMRFQEMSVFDVWAETFRAGPLFYVFMWFATAVSGAHAFLLLKVTGPLLYGSLAVVFFVFLRHGLKFEWKMAFVAALVLVLQVAALRIGWDRFRNVMGLIFVFTALTVLRSSSKYKWPLVAGLSVLAVLSREYIALILFVGISGFVFLERKERVVSLAVLAPAITVFVFMTYSARLWGNYFLSGQYIFESYLWTVRDVLSIFAVCYLLLSPFVLKGFRRDKLLGPIFGLLLFGSFGVVLSPWFAVVGYQRWLMLLVFPFSVFAVLGFARFRLFDTNHFRKLAAVVLVFIVIGVGYSTGAFSYVGMLPNSYVAVNLAHSSIAWNEVDSVEDVLGWIDENAMSNSSLLVEERFYGWTLIYLRRANIDVGVVAYSAASPPWSALERVLDDGFRWIYLIWYSDSVIESFHEVYSQEAVSVFQYDM